MQTVSRYLLTNVVICYVSGFHGRQSKVYDRRITIHRGVYNPISFTFKNEDQKAQDVVGKTYEFSIIDTETNQSVLTRTLRITDDGSTVSTKGTATVEVTPGDLVKLNAGFYNFSVRQLITDDGSTLVTYSDTGYNAAGTLEVLDGAYPHSTNSTTISVFNHTTGPLAKTSGSVYAYPGENNNKALHTIAVYTKNFSGAFRVQGTMASSPADADYFDITLNDSTTTHTFSSSTDVTDFNFTGVYHYVRFSWDNDTDNTGIIDKILYRR